MALDPLPLPEELDTFSHGETEVFSAQQRNQAIDQAAVLLWLATKVPAWTNDQTIDKLLKWAVLDMAWSLLVKTENKTEINSPFSSERIGSYSYSKATKQVTSGESTGVEWFDAAVEFLLGETGESAVWSTTEYVFTQPYVAEHAPGRIINDPSVSSDLWP